MICQCISAIKDQHPVTLDIWETPSSLQGCGIQSSRHSNRVHYAWWYQCVVLESFETFMTTASLLLENAARGGWNMLEWGLQTFAIPGIGWPKQNTKCHISWTLSQLESFALTDEAVFVPVGSLEQRPEI